MNDLLKGIVISGPTGVGKTDISIILAKKIHSDIISADSTQIYREMDIGTAKVTTEEMDGIKHYMLDIINPDEDYSVGDFEKEANRILKEKEKNGENIIIAGGTGLYIRALTDGFSDLPSKDEELRKELEKKTVEELCEKLEKIDIKAYNDIDRNNKVRLVRALEVCMLTEIKTENLKNNSYNFLKIFLTRNREEMYERINKRVDIMMNKGLPDEVRKIYDKYNKNRHKITAIGYKELFDYFDGIISLEKATEEIKKESRRYAKRQMTWFRKEKGYITYNLSEKSQEKTIEEILKEWEKI